MKKALIAVLASFLCIAMVSVAAAEDRLKIKGSFRARVYDSSNRDFNDSVDDDKNYFDMRMRVDSRLKLSDEAMARLRIDFQENNWGDDTGLFGRPLTEANSRNEYQANTLHIDRAYLQIKKPKFSLVVGHIFEPWGHSSAYGIQEMGIGLKIKTPVQINLNYFKLDENDSVLDSGSTEDKDLYAINVAYPKDGKYVPQRIGAYFAKVEDSSPADDSPYVLGAYGRYSLNDIDIKASLDIFGGQSTTTDYMGTQCWIGLDYPIIEKLNLGANLYYAKGADSGETQLNMIHRRYGGFEPMEKILYNFNDGQEVQVLAQSTPFDPNDDDSGSISMDIWGIYKITPTVALGLQLGYYTPENDSNTSFDSLTTATCSLKWDIAKKADVILCGLYATPEFTDNTPDDDKVVLAAKIEYCF